MNFDHTEFLKYIDTPEDLKKVPIDQLHIVANELRQAIIDHVSIYGGHLGASLGSVEITVALHYVFDMPYDNIVWDTGHQAYGHKIITGRRKNFFTNRIYGGLSGFPRRSESKFDKFGVGHSSTSLSAVLGMAIASKLEKDKKKKNIAVIGDGAMSAGIAFEGLNNIGITDSNVLIVLNDNSMSIDPNVGALSNYLVDMSSGITTSKTYQFFRSETSHILKKLPYIGEKAQDVLKKIESSVKGIIVNQSNLFETLNITYFGPVDGHNVKKMVRVLQNIKDTKGPKLLHCLTVKGKGVKMAERYQTKWHAPGLFDPKTEQLIVKKSNTPQPLKYQEVFGRTIVELAKKNKKIVGVTPAMPSGSSLNIMIEEIPERAFDVGIAEQHAVTFSAGMATQGYIPFCNIYSSFMQRAYDQVIHDVAIQKIPVIFCLDRAGVVGEDGATHHGSYDLAYFRCIPNMIVSAPMDEQELRNLMFTAQKDPKYPFSIRYPRGKGVMVDWKTPFKELEIGKGRKIRDGQEMAFLSIGHIGNEVKIATDMLCEKHQIQASHYDMRFLKPIDEDLLHEVFNNHAKVICVEDGSKIGGLGSAVIEFMVAHNYHARVEILGIPDRVIEHGKPIELWKECGFDVQSIVKRAILLVNKSLILSEEK